MVQFDNCERIMEARDHFKNGASLKSHMSRENFIRKVNMKVIISFVVMMAAIFSGSAQVFVGGGLGMSFGNGKSSLGSTDNSSSGFGFNISPQVGYFMTNDLAIGVSAYLGNNWSDSKRIDPDYPLNEGEQKSSRSSWGISAFGRYKLMELGIDKLSLLAEGSIGVQGSHEKHTANGSTTKYPGSTVYGVNTRPVLSYKLSDKIDVLAYCNFLTIGYNYQTNNNPELNHKSKSHNFNFGFNSFSDLDIGFIYKF